MSQTLSKMPWKILGSSSRLRPPIPPKPSRKTLDDRLTQLRLKKKAKPKPRPHTLSDIPFEMLLEIISWLDGAALSNLRLVNKFYATMVTPYLFGMVQIIYNNESFRMFSKLCHDPILSQHVRTILYSLRPLSYISKQEFESKAEKKLNAKNLDVSSRKTRKFYARVSGAWNSYERLIRDQKCVRSSGYDLHTFEACLKLLPNLERIEIDTCSEYYPRGMRRAFDEKFWGIEWGFLEGRGKRVDVIGIEREKPYQKILSSSEELRQKLKFLRIESYYTPIFSADPEEFDLTTLTNLRVLQLKIRCCCHKEDTDGWEEPFFEKLRKIITEGKSLRKVTIWFIKCPFGKLHVSFRLLVESWKAGGFGDVKVEIHFMGQESSFD